jgi:hypothetical protein
MDLLFSKYASPFLFVDLMISECRLCDFIDEIFKIEDERKTWEFYLHKVHDKSFDDFVSSIRSNRNNEISTEELGTTVKESASILAGFIPTERGE